MKKHYKIRQYSPIWWIGVIAAFSAIMVFTGLLNSWELGLL